MQNKDKNDTEGVGGGWGGGSDCIMSKCFGFVAN